MYINCILNYIIHYVISTFYIYKIFIFYSFIGKNFQIPSPPHSFPLPRGNHRSVLQVLNCFFLRKVLFVPYINSGCVILHDICLSLSDLLHLVWESLVPSMLLQWHYFVFFLVAESYSIVHCVYIPHLLNHVSVDGHLGCFQVLDIVNSAAITALSRYMPKSGIARSYGSGMDWEFEVNRSKLLHLEWISNEILLYSMGN